MYFQEFCERLANNGTVIPYVTPLPDEFREPLDVLVSIIKPKLSRLETMKITFIQNKFTDMDEVFDTLESIDDGDINDAIATELCERLYDETYDKLTTKEQAIIKVAAVYLMLQSANKKD